MLLNVCLMKISFAFESKCCMRCYTCRISNLRYKFKFRDFFFKSRKKTPVFRQRRLMKYFLVENHRAHNQKNSAQDIIGLGVLYICPAEFFCLSNRAFELFKYHT